MWTDSVLMKLPLYGFRLVFRISATARVRHRYLTPLHFGDSEHGGGAIFARPLNLRSFRYIAYILKKGISLEKVQAAMEGGYVLRSMYYLLYTIQQ